MLQHRNTSYNDRLLAAALEVENQADKERTTTAHPPAIAHPILNPQLSVQASCLMHIRTDAGPSLCHVQDPKSLTGRYRQRCRWGRS
jgi:hypothetical protein